MPANFLIVCGGSGRGILSQFDTLGFDGALQIDVQNWPIQTHDGRILQFELPIPSHHEPVPNSIASLATYSSRLKRQWGKHHKDESHHGEYESCVSGECVNYKRRVNHVQTATNNVVAAALIDGMSQNPIIGRSYITRDIVSQSLADKLQQLRSLKPANEQNVTVWLVASTCGGTGNGIVHHVADLVKQVFGDITLKLKFVRIGMLSYQSISRLTTVSTFWAVLTDYGYMKEHTRKTVSLAAQGVVYPVTQEFYYIDLPDTNTDTRKRESLVQSAFVTFSNPVLDREFVVRLNNGGGVVMARVGEWGRGFDRNAVYKLTLKQLNQKLDELLTPGESTVIAKVTNFIVTDPIELISQESTQLYATVAKSETMKPVLPSLRKIKTELNVVNSLESLRVHPLWVMMQQVVAQIFDEQKQNTLRKQVQLIITVDHETEQLSISGEANDAAHYVGAEAHIKLIRMAQYAKAKVKHYLLGNQDHAGYVLTELREAWNTIVGGWFIGDEERQQAFIGGVTRFLQAYFRVSRCIEVSDEAESVIMRARTEFRNLTLVVERQIQSINVDMPAEYTNCADLDETFGGNTTWLKMLRRSLVGNLEQAEQSKEFRRTVEMGASGLTEDGLKYVLESPAGSGSDQIVNQINTSEGSNSAVWWQGIQKPGSWEGVNGLLWFNYRIFPKLPGAVREKINRSNEAWGPTNARTSPIYIDINSPALGLKVYAVQCVVPAVGTDEVGQLRQLLSNTLNELKVDNPRYSDNSSFSKSKYIGIQCTRSQGIAVRIPATYDDERITNIRQLLDEYFVIDDEVNRTNIGGQVATPEVQL